MSVGNRSGGAVVECASEPITDPQQLRQLDEQRRLARFQFANRYSSEPSDPLSNYRITFGKTQSPLIKLRLDTLFMSARRALQDGIYGDETGYIYVFHDLGDPVNILKIGRTRRDARRRVSEWNRILAEAVDGPVARNVVLLYAYPTVANQFAERIIFEALRCERITNRLNLVTGDELSEFFRIDNFLALKIFIRQTLLFIDQFIKINRQPR